MVKGQEGKMYEEQLRVLGLFSLKETEGGPHRSYKFLVRGREGAGTNLFNPLTDGKTQGNGLKLWFRLDIRKRFFTQRVVEHCKRFPRVVVTTPDLTELKKSLANTLRHMMGFLCLSHAKQGVGL
ncbi:hypothetical protein DUI87_11236 [Hirundo rustica rustica]|uniref:Uncharacterized protein n=1 Tax=Hirundo rustica rustica TaxID=333673 RepID=A0A3M0KHL8_HIRRU|nr:hypothetical protein DUI87_11236 [Hirundo rustica rustica]